MKYSVLLSLYSKESPDYLKLALNSLFASTLPPDQIVIVKDGPLTADLEKVLSYYTGIEYSSIPINVGLSYALNIGLSICRNELVARMDTDDICHPDRFKKQFEFMVQNPAVDIVGTYAIKIDERGKEFGILKVPVYHDDIRKYIWTCPFIHPTVMFRKSKIEQIGSYNPNSGPRQDDYELWFRCALNGLIFANIPESLFYYRFFKDNVKKNSIKVGWSRFKVGFRGCRKLHLSLYAYIGVSIPLFRALLPYPLNVLFNELMIKVNPRSK